VLAIALLALFGCSDGGSTGPTTQEFNDAREELMAKLKKGKKKGAKAGGKGRSVATATASVAPAFSSAGSGFAYESRGLRDPFRSFEWEQMKLGMIDADSRTPLQQFDVSQLALVGIVWNVNRARALIQDPSGMSYIVAEGARIGKNDGRVIRINDNLMVVKETYVDFMGEATTKEIEMRIRTSEGG